mgnify:CR=1 FL=1
MAILQYQGCYISHTASTVGRIEAEGPLGACFDLIERDPYFGEESWEKAESEMVHRTLNVLLKKAAKKPEEIDLKRAQRDADAAKEARAPGRTPRRASCRPTRRQIPAVRGCSAAQAAPVQAGAPRPRARTAV